MTIKEPDAPVPRIRSATLADAEPISGLIKLFSYTYLVSPTPAETEAFLATLSAPAMRILLARRDIDYVVAEDPSIGVLAGVAGMRADGQLMHLFVHLDYQRRGLGRRLWEHLRDRAIRGGHSGSFKVSSSLNAMPVYERFGFVISGPRREKDGGVSVPMTCTRYR